MSNANEELGTFLRVDMDDGGFYAIQPQEESIVRKAATDWRERGIDSLLEMEHKHGYSITVAASKVVGFYPSTPEDRERCILEEIQWEEWEIGFRKAHATKEWEKG